TRVHARPTLFFRVLRFARYEDTAEIRLSARVPYADPWLLLRASAAADVANRSAMGRCRTNGVGRHRRLGGIRSAAVALRATDRARADIAGIFNEGLEQRTRIRSG